MKQESSSNETITADDVKLLEEVLECWNGLSNLDAQEHGYGMMTDHRHATFDAAECLVEKMKRLVKHSDKNAAFVVESGFVAPADGTVIPIPGTTKGIYVPDSALPTAGS